MKTREELQNLSIEELNKAYNSLVQCLQIINPDDTGLCDLSIAGKDMTLQLELAKVAIFSRIIELEKKMLKNVK